ncbi:shikimate kinase [Qipengyuania aquimaris]|uniref:Shikimate kinase n=1 Tax=Qipengyuania xiapuensis TaxID=2867236 RepID=A0ABX8ZY35_9SPHN|nr:MULTISPECIES: shikimate kinase [Qipengyuania]MBY6128444.1 shikimate kinase [Qipengyuania aquimaris]QZD93019.1 shikimate kinase [Qipengyuania xiapuensis]
MSNTPSPAYDIDTAAIAARIDRPLVLVGLMGVGKSTIGRRLAGALGRSFVDADEEIERAANRSVGEIFEAHGEAYFRDGERRVIARLMEEGHGVIATGGGAFVDEETRALVLENGLAIWLDCDLDTLVERTSRKDTRPLLKTGDPREILFNLKEQRGPAYSQAQIHVVTDDGPHEATVARILEELAAWR